MSYLPLLGSLVVVAGFALRLNPMLAVTASALVTGLLAGMGPVEVISAFGKAFNDNRIIAIVWIVLPVISLLERYGLQLAAAIGVPLLMGEYGGNPAVIGAIGMLAGFCGTLMTPMAANFNLVPAALLELKDRHGVIKAQVATALPLLAVNILLIWWLGFL